MTSLTLDTIDIHSTDRLEHEGYPWEAWDLLRERAPVHWYERDDIDPFWAITRYDDVHHVGSNDKLFINGGPTLRLVAREDDRLSKERSARRIEKFGWDPSEVPDLVYMDKPRHTEFRNLAARSFTPKAMRALEDHLEDYAARFTGQFEALLRDRGSADLVEDYAVALPLATICDIMGLPVDDRSRIHAWTDIFFANEDEAMRHAKPGETYEELRFRFSTEFYEYCAGIADQFKRHPDGSLSSRVANGLIHGEPLTPQQLHGYLVLLLGAGNETTRNAIAGGVIALINHPDQLARLCADPSLVDTATEEILRWTSPVIQFARTATQDVELYGKKIRKGDTVGLFYPSANRDGDQFDDPYRFDIGRQPNYHLAFGHGAHFCLGANLARWELRATLRALIPLLPRLALEGPPERHGMLHLGIVKRQQVALCA